MKLKPAWSSIQTSLIIIAYELAQVREHIIINDDVELVLIRDQAEATTLQLREGAYIQRGRSSSKDANPLFDPVVAQGLVLQSW